MPSAPASMPAITMPMNVGGSHCALDWRALHTPTASIANK